MQRFRFSVAEFFFARRVSTGATCFAFLIAARRTVHREKRKLRVSKDPLDMLLDITWRGGGDAALLRFRIILCYYSIIRHRAVARRA